MLTEQGLETAPGSGLYCGARAADGECPYKAAVPAIGVITGGTGRALFQCVIIVSGVAELRVEREVPRGAYELTDAVNLTSA